MNEREAKSKSGLIVGSILLVGALWSVLSGALVFGISLTGLAALFVLNALRPWWWAEYRGNFGLHIRLLYVIAALFGGYGLLRAMDLIGGQGSKVADLILAIIGASAALYAALGIARYYPSIDRFGRTVETRDGVAPDRGR